MSKIIKCPHCGNENDTSLCISTKDATPKNGDVSICVKCLSVSIFDDSLVDGVRFVTETEKSEIMNDEYFVDIMSRLDLRF